MRYISTRDASKKEITASEAIVRGLAPDGGLYVPCEFPKLEGFIGLDYNELALKVLSLYLTDFSEGELAEYIGAAYDGQLPVKLNGAYLELFHGQTSAFKDVALQLFPYLLTASLRKNGVDKTAVILVATSGDTGSAVLSGLKNTAGIRVIVFYPSKGVSDAQRLQMVTQTGGNLNVFGINGNFDDAQRAVKEVFADEGFKAQFADKYVFSSANSINLGRLVPQIVYYFYSYSELVGSGRIREGEAINYVVPTGNFGNILAGYYAYKMGLPVNKLICATNSNKVLDDYFKTGVYDSNREFYVTVSPAMDILVSSNLERLIYENAPKDIFDSDYATEPETIETIKRVYASDNYILDPHTAVAKRVYEKYKSRSGDETPALILATASPYKFAETVEGAIGKVLTDPPEGLRDLDKKPVLHGETVSDIKETVRKALS